MDRPAPRQLDRHRSSDRFRAEIISRLSGRERFFIEGIREDMQPNAEIEVRALADDGRETTFWVTARLTTLQDVDIYKQGGILHAVVREMA